MAVGKNKRVTKGGRKGGKKKVVDAFAKKEHYLVKAPSTFSTVKIGNTLCSKTQGLKIAYDSLKGRVFEVNLADLQKNEAQGHRKVKLICEDVQGRNVLTDFYGMDVTRDHLCSLIKKWHTMIEARVDVTTQDGYALRIFAVAFTKKGQDQVKRNCYAQRAQVRRVRNELIRVMKESAENVMLKDFVRALIPEAIDRAMEKACKGLFPLENVSIRKVKVMKKPKTDIAKLMELHDAGAEAEEAQPAEARNLLTAEVAATSAA